MSKLKTAFRGLQATNEPQLLRELATVGTADDGIVCVAHLPNHIYVRQSNGHVITVFSDRMNLKAGQVVWIGKSKDRPDIFQVLGLASVQQIKTQQLPLHAYTHEFGGEDTVYISSNQYLPGLVYPKGGLSVAIFPEPFLTPTGWVQASAPEIIDLSPYNTGVKWVVIQRDENGTPEVLEGSPLISKTELTVVNIPKPTKQARAAIALYGQSTIIKTAIASDIVDLRGSDGGGSGNHGLLINRDVAGNHAKLIPMIDEAGAIQITKADGTTPVISVNTGAENVGINTTVPGRCVDINNETGQCLQLTYNDGDGNAVNKVTLDVSDSGDMIITPSGGGVTIVGNIFANNLSGNSSIEPLQRLAIGA